MNQKSSVTRKYIEERLKIPNTLFVIRDSSKTSGFTLVEVLISLAIFTAIAVGLINLNHISVKGSSAAGLHSNAASVLEATTEQLMAVRASNFSALSPGTFHPVISGSQWDLTPGNFTQDGVTRWVEISTVQRQFSCAGERICPIVSSGGVVDPVTFKATVYVTWDDNGTTREESLETLLSFWR